jgi:hypothetical protein
MSKLKRVIENIARAQNSLGIEYGTLKASGQVEVGGAVLQEDLFSPPNNFDASELPEFEHIDPLTVPPGIAEHPEFAAFAVEVVGFSEQVSALSDKMLELQEFLSSYLRRERISAGDNVLVQRIGEKNIILGKAREL